MITEISKRKKKPNTRTNKNNKNPVSENSTYHKSNHNAGKVHLKHKNLEIRIKTSDNASSRKTTQKKQTHHLHPCKRKKLSFATTPYK